MTNVLFSSELCNSHHPLIVFVTGWGNYRHQSDICHAAKILKQNGMPEDHVSWNACTPH